MDFKNQSVGRPPTTTQSQSQTPAQSQLQPPATSRYIQHHQSSTYFTQQAVRAGYMAPHFGHALDNYQYHPSNVHEAIRREIEKERIREEIIAEEVARRRMLEIEVRRELMMERELAMRREGVSSYSSLGMSFSPTLPLLKQQTDMRSVEEIIGRSIEERIRGGMSVSGLGPRNENGRLDVVPFQERISEVPFQHRRMEPQNSVLKLVSDNQSAEPQISELQPPKEPSKETDRIIMLAKPDTSLSGSKRKAVTPPVVEIAPEPPSSSFQKKSGKEEWSCALCQVSATCERGLNEHLQGKKHKNKEAALRAHRNGKNYSIGLFPKKPKTLKLVEANNNLSQEVISDREGAKDNNAPLLPFDVHLADGLKKNENDAKKKQKSVQQKKRKFKFWCESCNIGTLSEKMMEAHRVGKKHVARLRELNSRSIATSTTQVGITQSDERAVVVEQKETDVDEAANVSTEQEEETAVIKQSDVQATEDVDEAVGINPEEPEEEREAVVVKQSETQITEDVDEAVSINPEEQEEEAVVVKQSEAQVTEDVDEAVSISPEEQEEVMLITSDDQDQSSS